LLDGEINSGTNYTTVIKKLYRMLHFLVISYIIFKNLFICYLLFIYLLKMIVMFTKLRLNHGIVLIATVPSTYYIILVYIIYRTLFILM